MSDEGLNITRMGEIAVVTFHGAAVLDLSTSESLRTDLLRLADSPPAPKIIVDFSAVRFLGSRMLGVLVELSRRAETGKGKVVITGLHENVSKVFQITKLSRLLHCSADLNEAACMLGEVLS